MQIINLYKKKIAAFYFFFFWVWTSELGKISENQLYISTPEEFNRPRGPK